MNIFKISIGILWRVQEFVCALRVLKPESFTVIFSTLLTLSYFCIQFNTVSFGKAVNQAKAALRNTKLLRVYFVGKERISCFLLKKRGINVSFSLSLNEILNWEKKTLKKSNSNKTPELKKSVNMTFGKSNQLIIRCSLNWNKIF